MSRTLLILFLTLGLLVFCGCSSDFKISRENGEKVLERYEGRAEEVIIPEGVTKIKSLAFRHCDSLKFVVIPETVREIEKGAFFKCNSLESVMLPCRLEKFEPDMFHNCMALQEWPICSTNPDFKAVGKGLLTKDGKRLVRCLCSAEEYQIPDGVVEIAEGAFSGCCFLKSVGIPESLEKFTPEVFFDCPALQEWPIPSTNPDFKAVGEGLLTKDGKRLLRCLGTAEEYQIPDGVTEIADKAFSGCYFLKSVTIPESVTHIGSAAFGGCTSLVSVVIPEGVTAIPGAAFEVCDSLESVVIPQTVTKIGDLAFGGCISLESVQIPESVTEIGEGAFRDCCFLQSVVIPEKVKVIPYMTFHGCVSLETVVISSGVEEIEEGAFSECNSLKTLVIPESVKKISGEFYCRDLVIRAPKGSWAEAYARKNGIHFESE